jgi:hypothetical protein
MKRMKSKNKIADIWKYESGEITVKMQNRRNQDNGKDPNITEWYEHLEWVEGKSEAEYIHSIRTKSGLDLPIHELEAEGANGNVSTVVKGNSGSLQRCTTGGLETSLFNEMQGKRMPSTSSKEENW